MKYKILGFILSVFLLGSFSHATATIYYVRTTGNDSNDGSTGTPWLTVNHGIGAISSGDTLLIGDGTYQEDSGSGYLLIQRTFSTETIIQPENGSAGNVTIQGASSNSAEVIFTNSTNQHYKWLNFTSRTNNVAKVLRFNGPNISTITFESCNITQASSSTVFIALGTQLGSGATFYNVTIASCNITSTGGLPADGIYFSKVTEGDNVSNFTIYGSSVTTSRRSLRLEGVNNVSIHNNYLYTGHPTSTNGTGVSLGIDGTSGLSASGVIYGNTIISIAGHAMLIGAGVTGSTVTSNVIYGGTTTSNGQGFVIKEATGVISENNLIYSGWNSGLYSKASFHASINHNTIIGRTTQDLGALRVGFNSEDNATTTGISVINSRVVDASTGIAIFIGSVASADIDNTCVIDSNTYDVRVSTGYGRFNNVVVSSVAGAQSAWASYGNPNNDKSSLDANNGQLIPYQHTTSGVTLYFTVRNNAGAYWNGTSFEIQNNANWYTYGRFMAEDPQYSAYYTGMLTRDLPSNLYQIDIYQMARSWAQMTDTKLTSASVSWGGTSYSSIIFNSAAVTAASLGINTILSELTTIINKVNYLTIKP